MLRMWRDSGGFGDCYAGGDVYCAVYGVLGCFLSDACRWVYGGCFTFEDAGGEVRGNMLQFRMLSLKVGGESGSNCILNCHWLPLNLFK